MSDVNWQDLCVGRENEKQTLRDTWQRVKNGEPGFIVLRGESGYGKTRILQDFYSWLSASDQEDPDQYWPDTIGHGANALKINPSLDDFGKGSNIPYIWWGIRWNTPDSRNQVEGSMSGILDSLEYLIPHQKALEYKQKEVDRGKKIGILLAKLIASPFTLGLTDAYDNLKTVIEIRNEEKTAQLESQQSIQERQTEEVRRRLETLTKFLASVLNSKGSSSPSVPIIMAFDDSQWMDPISLEYIENLFMMAIKLNWPLLIIATHWEREWHLDSSSNEEDLRPKLAKTYNKIHSLQAEVGAIVNMKIVDCEKITELQEVLKIAIPGLSSEQEKFLLDCADGNPLLLQQIILEIIGEPYYFVDENVNGPLTSEALRDLKNRTFELHSVQKKRFEKIPKSLQKILSYASYHGMRFLPDFIVEISKQMSETEDVSSQMFSQCEYPHAIISRSNRDICEFRNKLFYDIAIERINKFPSLGRKLKQQLLIRGEKWIEENKQASLSPVERRAFYLVILKYCDEVNEVAIRLASVIRVKLAIHDWEQGYLLDSMKWSMKIIESEKNYSSLALSNNEASNLIGVWVDLHLFDEALKLCSLELEKAESALELSGPTNSDYPELLLNACYFLQKKASILRSLRKLDEALSVSQKALTSCEHFFESNPKGARLIEICRTRTGDILTEIGNQEQAIKLYELSLRQIEREIEINGETYRLFSKLLAVKTRIAGQLADKGELEKAYQLYLSSLGKLKSATEKYGKKLETLRDFSFIQARIGCLFRDVEKYDKALKYFNISLTNTERHIELYGESPLLLSDMATTQGHISDILNKQGKNKEALELCQQTLVSQERAISLFGETYESLRSYSNCQEKIAGLLYKNGKGDLKQALHLYKIVLATRTGFRLKYAESPESIRDLTCAYENVAMILRNQGKFDEAFDYYQKSLNLREYTIQIYGETPQSLRDLNISQGRVSGMYLLDQKFDEALIGFRKALDISERRLQLYGEIPSVIREIDLYKSFIEDSIAKRTD